jgi:tetratricopeptide (TPR) repeat protein
MIEWTRILSVLLIVEQFECTNASRSRLRKEWRRARGAFCLFLTAFVLLVFAAQNSAATPSFQTSLDRDTVSLGDNVTLSLTFTDCNPNGQPELPHMEGLEPAGGVSTSQQTQFINGSVSSSVVYSIPLRPTHLGTFRIPPMQITINGTRLSSQPLTLNVTKSTAPQGAFVKLVVPDKPVYVGQVFPVQMQCYCLYARQVQLPQLSGDGFNVGTIPSYNQQPPQVNISNTLYYYLNFRAPVTAVKTGTLTLGPASWSLVLVTTKQDSFFPFGMSESHPITVTSDTTELKVLPIPTNAPPGFAGAVGTFVLSQFEVGPTNVAVGDPITLKVRISGRGAFDGLTLPSDPVGWREFKTYPPSAKFESTDPIQIDGSKYFEQVVTPLNAEIKELPSFTFVYFDPDAGAFKTLTHPPVPLAIHPASGVAQPTVVSLTSNAAENQPAAQEIVHIKEHLGSLQAIAPPLIQRPGFLFLQALAPAIWLGALVWRHQKDKLANNPRLRRERQVARTVAEGLNELSRQAAANKTQEFYATVVRLLQEQLGERLDLPASAITEAAVQEAQNRGLDAETEKLLRELFQICNQFRYAPDRSSQELASLIPKVQTVLKNLRAWKPSASTSNVAFAQGLGLGLLMLLAASSLSAETPGESFDQANKLYERSKFAEAAAAYQKIIDSGQVSAALYFNLGNAWFKAGQPGRAIFAFRQAEALSPRDPDIRANLQFARNQVGGGSYVPAKRWTAWLNRLTLNEWSAAASGALVLFFLLLAARQVWPRLKTGNGLPAFLASVSVFLIACLAVTAEDRLGEKTAVVIVPEAVARQGPLDESQSAFSARDGTELAVLDQKSDWLEVADSAKHIGWLPEKDVVR